MSTYLWIDSAQNHLMVNATDYLDIGGVELDLVTGDYPSSPKPIAMTVSSYSPAFSAITHGLKRQVRTRGAHAWRLSLTYGAMTQAQTAPIVAFIAKQAGIVGTFTVAQLGLANRGTSGTGAVNGAGQTGTSLVTDGWTFNSPIFKNGDFLQIDGDTKVYQVTADVTASGAGAATIPIFPALRKSPPDNFPVRNSVTWLCSLSEDMLNVDWSHCLMTNGFTVDLTEVQ